MPITITVPAANFFDQVQNRFIVTKETTLTFEHSLISISKWESKWHKPFLNTMKKTVEESIDYYRCMCLSKDVDPNVFYALSQNNVKTISDYIADPMTAKKFKQKDNNKASNEIVTSDLIYFWMSNFSIPFVPCEKWHLNRLMTLIHIASIKNSPKKKMGKQEAASQRAALNAQRKAKYHTRG